MGYFGRFAVEVLSNRRAPGIARCASVAKIGENGIAKGVMNVNMVFQSHVINAPRMNMKNGEKIIGKRTREVALESEGER